MINNLIKEVITLDNYIIIENGNIIELAIPSSLSVIKESNEELNKPNEVIVLRSKKNENIDIQVVYLYKNDGQTNNQLRYESELFSNLNVYENHISLDLNTHNVETDIEYIVDEESSINVICLNELCNGVSEIVRTNANVKRNGNLNIANALINDGNTKIDFNFNLVGENASCINKNVVVSSNEQNKQIISRVNHLAKFSKGEIISHGVAFDKSTLNFEGISSIPNGMAKSDARQELRLMMLGEAVKASANPVLLIDEFDVMASHAAGVGQIDEEALYYLQSRGLSKSDAEKLIVRGFLMPIMDNIKYEEVAKRFVSIIENKTK